MDFQLLPVEEADLEAMGRFLKDPEVMYAYEHGFTDEEVRQWLDRQDEDHVLRRRAELFSALTGEERRTLEELLEKLGEDWTRRFARERPPEERGRKKKDSD